MAQSPNFAPCMCGDPECWSCGPAQGFSSEPAGINDDLPKVFTVQVELIIRASNELEMEEALYGVVQGGGVDMDNQKILEWRYR